MRILIQLLFLLLLILLIGVLLFGIFWVTGKIREERILREMIERLSASSRVAEVVVTDRRYDRATERILTSVRFREFDVTGAPLETREMQFASDLIHFQTLVIRFDDNLIKHGDRLRGKSVYLFLKAFTIDGPEPKAVVLTSMEDIPRGYKVPGARSDFEERLWESFWAYALRPEERVKEGIKNAQLEAPGMKFLPGYRYTLHIEHNGGLRIDTEPLPEILDLEKLQPV